MAPKKHSSLYEQHLKSKQPRPVVAAPTPQPEPQGETASEVVASVDSGSAGTTTTSSASAWQQAIARKMHEKGVTITAPVAAKAPGDVPSGGGVAARAFPSNVIATLAATLAVEAVGATSGEQSPTKVTDEAGEEVAQIPSRPQKSLQQLVLEKLAAEGKLVADGSRDGVHSSGVGGGIAGARQRLQRGRHIKPSLTSWAPPAHSWSGDAKAQREQLQQWALLRELQGIECTIAVDQQLSGDGADDQTAAGVNEIRDGLFPPPLMRLDDLRLPAALKTNLAAHCKASVDRAGDMNPLLQNALPSALMGYDVAVIGGLDSATRLLAAVLPAVALTTSEVHMERALGFSTAEKTPRLLILTASEETTTSATGLVQHLLGSSCIEPVAFGSHNSALGPDRVPLVVLGNSAFERCDIAVQSFARFCEDVSAVKGVVNLPLDTLQRIVVVDADALAGPPFSHKFSADEWAVLFGGKAKEGALLHVKILRDHFAARAASASEGGADQGCVEGTPTRREAQLGLSSVAPYRQALLAAAAMTPALEELCATALLRNGAAATRDYAAELGIGSGGDSDNDSDLSAAAPVAVSRRVFDGRGSKRELHIVAKLDRSAWASVVHEVMLVAPEQRLAMLLFCITKTPPPVVVLVAGREELQLVHAFFTEEVPNGAEIATTDFRDFRKHRSQQQQKQQQQQQQQHRPHHEYKVLLSTPWALSRLGAQALADLPTIRHVINFSCPSRDVAAQLQQRARLIFSERARRFVCLMTTMVTRQMHDRAATELREALSSAGQHVPQFLHDVVVSQHRGPRR